MTVPRLDRARLPLYYDEANVPRAGGEQKNPRVTSSSEAAPRGQYFYPYFIFVFADFLFFVSPFCRLRFLSVFSAFPAVPFVSAAAGSLLRIFFPLQHMPHVPGGQLPRGGEEKHERRRADRRRQRNLRHGPHRALSEPRHEIAAEVVNGVDDDARGEAPGQEQHERAHPADQKRIRHLQQRRADAGAAQKVEEMRGAERRRRHDGGEEQPLFCPPEPFGDGEQQHPAERGLLEESDEKALDRVSGDLRRARRHARLAREQRQYRHIVDGDRKRRRR